jgi:hypothetical protein
MDDAAAAASLLGLSKRIRAARKIARQLSSILRAMPLRHRSQLSVLLGVLRPNWAMILSCSLPARARVVVGFT